MSQSFMECRGTTDMLAYLSHMYPVYVIYTENTGRAMQCYTSTQEGLAGNTTVNLGIWQGQTTLYEV